MYGIEPMIPAAASPAPFPDIMPFRLVAIGASAGGIPVMQQLLTKIPASFPLPIVLLQHLSASLPSFLPKVLGFRTPLRCKWAEPGETPQPGTVYAAPPGKNLAMTSAGSFEHVPGPKPRLGWPSADIFLHSMARHIGDRGIAVILSGMLYDGADGIAAVRRAGGATMVQDPRSADYPSMPIASIDLGRADLTLSLDAIAEALQILAESGVH